MPWQRQLVWVHHSTHSPARQTSCSELSSLKMSESLHTRERRASSPTKTYLDKAVGIHNVEAYHAAGIRTRIFQAGAAVQSASQAIAATRAKLDGSNTDDIGVGVNAGAATIVDNDANGMTYARTTSQVLSIVYGGGAAGVGGAFYPNGMNGTIK
jgi:hypothetical protein